MSETDINSDTTSVEWYEEGWTCKCGTQVPVDLNCYKCGEPENDNEEGYWSDKFTIEFPAKREVCGCCDGKGTTYLGWSDSEQPAFTYEDFAEEGPDFYEDYMTGRYDRQCPECKGLRVIKVIEEKSVPEKLKPLYQAYRESLEADYYFDAISEAERRFGC